MWSWKGRVALFFPPPFLVMKQAASAPLCPGRSTVAVSQSCTLGGEFHFPHGFCVFVICFFFFSRYYFVCICLCICVWLQEDRGQTACGSVFFSLVGHRSGMRLYLLGRLALLFFFNLHKFPFLFNMYTVFWLQARRGHQILL